MEASRISFLIFFSLIIEKNSDHKDHLRLYTSYILKLRANFRVSVPVALPLKFRRSLNTIERMGRKVANTG